MMADAIQWRQQRQQRPRPDLNIPFLGAPPDVCKAGVCIWVIHDPLNRSMASSCVFKYRVWIVMSGVVDGRFRHVSA
jgi:hypothetical protein